MKDGFIKNCNKLARKLYKAKGFNCPEGYCFESAKHPEEVSLFATAVRSYNFWKDIFEESQQSDKEEKLNSTPAAEQQLKDSISDLKNVSRIINKWESIVKGSRCHNTINAVVAKLESI